MSFDGRHLAITLTLIACAVFSGCRIRGNSKHRSDTVCRGVVCQAVRTCEPCDNSSWDELANPEWIGNEPLTSSSELPSEFWEMTLDEAIAVALSDTTILRSLNANVLQNSSFVPSSFDPAINATDPNFGVEAALSAFDARLNSSLTYANNDDVFNNPVLSGGAAEVQQDLTIGQFNLSKTAATGTQFGIQSSVQHDNNTNPSVLFPSAWTTNWEATLRQPLLQGRGVRFNRIAGPNSQLGLRNSNGVLISRLNHDVTIIQFQRDVRTMVDEIVNAYWQLQLAYKNFDSIKASRDGSLKTWNIAKARQENGLPGGEADRELQAREQYYQFQAQLLAALNGDQTGSPGVLQSEANLRRLLNLPQSDGQIIRPADEPIVAETIVDWSELANQAIRNRTEVREQLKLIKRRVLEHEAAKNFTLPRLDAIATYRNNGFGDDLINGGSDRFSGAIDNAIAGDYNEWEVGFAMDVPIGFRQAHAAVRNAEFQLCRERAVLAEQVKQVTHDLGSALRQCKQSYANIEIAQLRREAADGTVDSRFAAYEADAIGFDELLDAQGRQLAAQLAYDSALINFELARNRLYLESGKLLFEHGISLCDSCVE